ncbi:MAG: tetratricopeptide repeat protein [Elusimicrobia bacterium]|nr:tetratricopeptide repeat protein [Elusimicrobiota bacterium]
MWGTGIGSFKVIYPAFRRPQIFHIEAKHNTETDHAENEYLEVWFDEGFVGFGIFLWVVVTFSLVGYRTLAQFVETAPSRAGPPGKGAPTTPDLRAYYVLAFLSAMLAMLIHNSVDVSLRFVSSGVFLWLLIGLLGALAVHDPLRENFLSPTSGVGTTAERSLLGDLLRVLASAAAVVFLGYVLVTFNEIQGPYPPTFGESLLWGISWAALVGVCGGAGYAWLRYLWSTPSWVALIGACLALWPLTIFWGYFRADAYHNRAIFFSKQAKWEEALNSYKTVVQLNPAFIMAYYFMGNVYNDRWSSGDGERAIAKYHELWRMAPNYVQSHYQAGLVHLHLGDEQQRQAEAATQRNDAASAERAAALANQYWREALRSFQHYHALDPVFSPNYARMAWVYIQLKDFPKAEATYREDLEAIECRSPKHNILREGWEKTHRHENPETYVNLGDAQYYQGRLQDAERSFRQALALKADYPNALRNLAILLAQTQRLSEGRQLWERLRQLTPKTPPFDQALGLASPT